MLFLPFQAMLTSLTNLSQRKAIYNDGITNVRLACSLAHSSLSYVYLHQFASLAFILNIRLSHVKPENKFVRG